MSGVSKMLSNFKRVIASFPGVNAVYHTVIIRIHISRLMQPMTVPDPDFEIRRDWSSRPFDI